MSNKLEILFVLNAAVLCVHQIDAAFWHEWELFGIPGGNQVNLLLNLPILATVFFAYRQVLLHTSRYRAAHIYLAFLGLLTVSLHSAFFLASHQQFAQPMSITLLLATGLLSVAQLLCLKRTG